MSTFEAVCKQNTSLQYVPIQGLGLVFVAVYQRALKLLYVDELLERVKQEFSQQYKPDQVGRKKQPSALSCSLQQAKATATCVCAVQV